MQGTIYNLFVKKWEMYGWKLWLGYRLLDLTYLLLLFIVSTGLKHDPSAAGMTPVTCLLGFVALLAVADEGMTARLFWLDLERDLVSDTMYREETEGGGRYLHPRLNQRDSLVLEEKRLEVEKKRNSTSSLFKKMWAWLSSHPMLVPLQLVSYLFAVVACLMILCGVTPVSEDLGEDEGGGWWGRRLRGHGDAKSGGVGGGGDTGAEVRSEGGGVGAALWMLLSLSFALKAWTFAGWALLPPQLTHLNLFFLMIGRMMRTDLATFLTSTPRHGPATTTRSTSVTTSTSPPPPSALLQCSSSSC